MSIKGFLTETCSSILDIGCGVAGIDVFLGNHYGESCPRFHLLDKTYLEKSIWYGIKNKGTFYGSLDLARKMLVLINIPEKCINLIEATSKNDINIDCKVDLIVSLISWGFHYPVETYLQKAYELLSEGGAIILDIRKGTNGKEAIIRAFGKCEIILEQKRFQRVLAKK